MFGRSARRVVVVLLLAGVCLCAQSKPDIFAQVTALLAERIDDQRAQIENLKSDLITVQNQITVMQERITTLEEAQK